MSINAVVTKLNKQALDKAIDKSLDKANGPGGSSFKDMFNEISSGQDFADKIGIDGNAQVDPTVHMESLGGEGFSFTPDESATSIGKPDAGEKVVDMLGEVNKGQMQMDSLMNHVLYSGKKFSNQELLVIQAHVFHFAQMTELTVKVAEQSVSSVKAVLNTQVQ